MNPAESSEAEADSVIGAVTLPASGGELDLGTAAAVDTK